MPSENPVLLSAFLAFLEEQIADSQAAMQSPTASINDVFRAIDAIRDLWIARTVAHLYVARIES